MGRHSTYLEQCIQRLDLNLAWHLESPRRRPYLEVHKGLDHGLYWLLVRQSQMHVNQDIRDAADGFRRT